MMSQYIIEDILCNAVDNGEDDVIGTLAVVCSDWNRIMKTKYGARASDYIISKAAVKHGELSVLKTMLAKCHKATFIRELIKFAVTIDNIGAFIILYDHARKGPEYLELSGVQAIEYGSYNCATCIYHMFRPSIEFNTLMNFLNMSIYVGNIDLMHYFLHRMPNISKSIINILHGIPYYYGPAIPENEHRTECFKFVLNMWLNGMHGDNERIQALQYSLSSHDFPPKTINIYTLFSGGGYEISLSSTLPAPYEFVSLCREYLRKLQRSFII